MVEETDPVLYEFGQAQNLDGDSGVGDETEPPEYEDSEGGDEEASSRQVSALPPHMHGCSS